MLAPAFLNATELKLPRVECDALITVLGMLERGEITDARFDMNRFAAECGTVMCLCGWAHHVSRGEAFPELSEEIPFDKIANRLPVGALDLFAVECITTIGQRSVLEDVRTNARAHNATAALRSYLTTGEPRWKEAMT